MYVCITIGVRIMFEGNVVRDFCFTFEEID